MIELKYNSYNEMPIKIYNKLVEISNDESLSEYDKHFNIISLLADMELDDVMNLPLSELNGINSKLEFITTFNFNKDRKFKKDKIKINGITYKITEPSANLSVAQYVDFQQYTDSKTPDVSCILSTILIPEGKTYNKDYDIFNTIDDIKNNLDIITAIELQNFITKKYAKYINHILRYLKIQTKLMRMTPIMKKEKKEIVKKIQELCSKIG